MRYIFLLVIAFSIVSGASAQKPAFITAPPLEYLLKPGDSIDVFYRYTPEFNQAATVQPNGVISLQVVGDVKVGGRTVTEAAGAITSAAAVKLNAPVVSISLKDFDGPHFTVLGEVGKPGRFDLRGNMTVNDAVAIAGGIKLTGRYTQVVLIHRIDDTTGRAELVDFKRLEHKKDGQTGGDDFLKLLNGDLIIVPENKISKIDRIVKLSSFSLYYGL